jgi:hypothetical protein
MSKFMYTFVKRLKAHDAESGRRKLFEGDLPPL